MTRFLLDTNVVVWLLLGERTAMTSKALQILEDSSNTLLVSAASVWEIAFKRSVKKLEIDEGWADSLGDLEFQPVPVTAASARLVESLPWHHRDPFDRLLIAQAMVEGCPIVTSDERIKRYDIATIW